MCHALALAACLVVPLLGGCLERAKLPQDAGYGPHPWLPPPLPSGLVPTLVVAPGVGWDEGKGPTPAPGFAVAPYARGLAHPRWLHVLPNGDVLVAETNGPDTEESRGLRAWLMKRVKAFAGSGVASPNRITLLRDADGDGIAETRSVFLEGLSSPFGMQLVDRELYVADTDALLRFPYRDGQTRIDAAPVRVAALPGGPINHHWTKNVIADAEGRRLYVAVGSNSNAGENGIEAEAGRAAILAVEAASGATSVFASGLRNPVGMAWQPETRRLWTVVNERDELGSDLVPDYLTEVKAGAFYGFPYSYYGQNVDERVAPQRPDLVARAIVPDYALGAHTASLGLAFYDGDLLPARYRGGAFIGQHGSWNRRPRAGYRVIFVPFRNGRPAGPPEDVLDGFVDARGRAHGRPVGVAVDRAGALLVADDVGNTVWRVVPETAGGAAGRSAQEERTGASAR